MMLPTPPRQLPDSYGSAVRPSWSSVTPDTSLVSSRFMMLCNASLWRMESWGKLNLLHGLLSDLYLSRFICQSFDLSTGAESAVPVGDFGLFS